MRSAPAQKKVAAATGLVSVQGCHAHPATPANALACGLQTCLAGVEKAQEGERRGTRLGAKGLEALDGEAEGENDAPTGKSGGPIEPISAALPLWVHFAPR